MVLKWQEAKHIRMDVFLFIHSEPILTMHLAKAHTKVGLVGVKVWICNGEVYGKRDLSPNIGAKNAAPKGKGGGMKRRKKSKQYLIIFTFN